MEGSMPLRNLMDTILRRRTAPYADFSIGSERVLDPLTSGEATGFVPEETYFEIRLSQMYLNHEREYWREFLPLASLMAEFQFAGERRTVPMVIGPELLEGGSQLAKSGRVEFLNIRAAGPYPYMGDDVEFFFGLFRMATNNWAKRVLSLLESVTKAFDVSKLSSFVNVAGPLVDGVQGLLGMSEVEMRMAVYRHLATPPDLPPDRLPDTAMRRGFHALIGAPPKPISVEEQRRFWVRDGRLWYGETADRLVPYDAADFLLVRMVPLSTRFDYSTFDFHKVHWPKVKEHIWNGQADAARQSLRLLAANLVQCQDLTLSHRNALLAKYRRQFEDEMNRYQEFQQDDAGLQGFEGAPAARLDEAELREAILTSPRQAAVDPAIMLAMVDI
jgi:hypothetical protein